MMTLYAQQSSAENEHTGFCLFCPLQLRPLTCGFASETHRLPLLSALPVGFDDLTWSHKGWLNDMELINY